MAERRAWDHGGKTAAQRGYGRQHRRLRDQLLRERPLCEHCQAKGRVTVATVADHTVSIAKGGAVHDIKNLTALCVDCHRDKSNLERGFRVRPRIAPDGWPE